MTAATKKMSGEQVLILGLTAVLTGVVSYVVGSLIAARNKVGKTEFTDLLNRVAALEKADRQYVTRDDLKEATKELREYFRESLKAQESRFDVAMKALINEVRGRNKVE